jgi:hypothetical protein
MGRVRLNIKVKRRPCWTLFDLGSRNTYVNRDVAKLLELTKVPETRTVRLGGAEHELKKMAFLKAMIDGKSLETQAYVLDDIGNDEDGKPIEILFGALAMQQWGIRVVRAEERLDLTHFTKEFVEY